MGSTLTAGFAFKGYAVSVTTTNTLQMLSQKHYYSFCRWTILGIRVLDNTLPVDWASPSFRLWWRTVTSGSTLCTFNYILKLPMCPLLYTILRSLLGMYVTAMVKATGRFLCGGAPVFLFDQSHCYLACLITVPMQFLYAQTIIHN